MAGVGPTLHQNTLLHTFLHSCLVTVWSIFGEKRVAIEKWELAATLDIFPNIAPSLGWELQARLGLRQDWLGTETQSCWGRVWHCCWGTTLHSCLATRSGSELHLCLGTFLEKDCSQSWIITNCWLILPTLLPSGALLSGHCEEDFSQNRKMKKIVKQYWQISNHWIISNPPLRSRHAPAQSCRSACSWWSTPSWALRNRGSCWTWSCSRPCSSSEQIRNYLRLSCRYLPCPGRERGGGWSSSVWPWWPVSYRRTSRHTGCLRTNCSRRRSCCHRPSVVQSCSSGWAPPCSAAWCWWCTAPHWPESNTSQTSLQASLSLTRLHWGTRSHSVSVRVTQRCL